MTVTTTSVLSNSVATAYDRDYIERLMLARLWFDMVDWGAPVGGDLRGSAIKDPIMERLAPATSALTEGSDATPVALDDDGVTVTVYEYGNVAQTTRLLKTTAYTDIERGAATAIADNQARSLDIVIREVFAAGSLVLYPGTVTARASLDTTNDKVDYELLMSLVSMAVGMGIPPFEDGTYVCPVHPAVMQDIQQMTEWVAVGEYSDPKLLYYGKPGVIGNGGRFKNEMGMIGGLRFVRHPLGKLWLGGGTPAQAATDIDGAAAAGDTDIDVTSASGIAAGDWITIGKGTATEEQVQVTAVSTNNLTIRGGGNTFSNFGLKYAHADEVAVVESPNVAAIPVLGPKSIRGRFASDPGKNGEVSVEFKSTDIPRRFLNHAWYWIGGFALMQKFALRAEVACTGNILGDNFG